MHACMHEQMQSESEKLTDYLSLSLSEQLVERERGFGEESCMDGWFRWDCERERDREEEEELGRRLYVYVAFPILV